MNGPIVVDVGNTRIKWGRCDGLRVVEAVSLPPDDADAWQAQLVRWAVASGSPWVVSGVQPGRRDALVGWLRRQRADLCVLDSHAQLPLSVAVEEPARVGIDRLLNAVAANTRRPPGYAAVIVDAGSAVTVDLVDNSGAFRGGAIFPGLRLMARALHEHTALLPEVAVDRAEAHPGTCTIQAIHVGVYNAVLGGITGLIAGYSGQSGNPIHVYFTGGDGHLMLNAWPTFREHWPEMTLEGILHSIPKAAPHG